MRKSGMRLKSNSRSIYGLTALVVLGLILGSGEPTGTFAKKSKDELQAERRTVNAGYTYFHRQTQNSLSQRLDYLPEQNLLRLVWMGAVDEQGAETRGSYYTLYDLRDDDMAQVSDWKRVEFANAGWPDMSRYSDGTIGIASHTPAQFSKNSRLREESFQTISAAPFSTFFPRSAVGTSDRTHMVYTYVSGSKARHSYYVQSDDLGSTWSSELAMTSSASPDGAGPRMLEFDAVDLDARGDDVVFVYLDGNHTLHQRRSSDNGASWQNLTTVMQPEFTRFNDLGTVSGSAVFVSDTVFAPGSDFDVRIDGLGRVHLVFSLLRVYVSGLGARQGGEIVRDGRDTIHVDTTAFGRFGLAYKLDNQAGFTEIGRPGGDTWDGVGTFVERGTASSYSRYPQLALDADNRPYCVYTSVKNGDMTDLTRAGDPVTIRDALYGHIYVTRELSPGNWTVAQDLSPEGRDCMYGAVAPFVDDHLFIAWQQGDRPGLRLENENPELDSVVILRFPVEDLTDVIASVSELTQVPATSQFELEVFPNPVGTEFTLRVNAQQTADVELRLYDAIGNLIGNLYRGRVATGVTDLPISIENFQLPDGVYYCTISDGRSQAGIGLRFFQ